MKQVKIGHDIINSNPNIDLIYGEIKQILDAYKEKEEKSGKWEAIYHLLTDVYMMGIAVGFRQGKKECTK